MDGSLVLSIITVVAACSAATTAWWGLRYAKGLLDAAVHDRRVDRVLALHSDLTTGEVGAARCRFIELMYKVGEEAFGCNQCWQPTWQSLLPPNLSIRDGTGSPRLLGIYPSDIVGSEGRRPLDDLRLILWCFERIDESCKTGTSLDEQLVVSLIGYHAAWWNLLCKRLEPTAGGYIHSLVRLAEWMEDRHWRDDPRYAHRKAIEDDFREASDDSLLPALPIFVSGGPLSRQTEPRSAARPLSMRPRRSTGPVATGVRRRRPNRTDPA